VSEYQSIDHGSNVTNTLEHSSFYKSVIKTCEHIQKVLSDHCGPYASDALLIQNNDGKNLKDPHYAIFTKDGINIVRSIEFVSPIQKHIQNLIAYVGSRVDSKSHDGTTTAMLFFTTLLAEYYRWISTYTRDEFMNLKEVQELCRKDMISLTEILENYVITIDKFAKLLNITNTEAVKKIAYYQAMLSSKGDKELSDAIVEVVETLPVELYGLFSVSQSKIETDKRFTVVRDDYTFVMSVVSNLDDMNHRMNTEYLSESCDLIVSEDDLVKNNPAITLIENLLTEALNTPRNCDLVIVTKSIDSILLGMISSYNRSHKYKIIVFNFSTHKPYSSRITLLMALSAVAGVYSMQDHVIDPNLPYIIRNTKVHFYNRRLYVSNLYEKDGSPYHPFFNNPEMHIPYTKMINDIREELNGFSSGRRRVETAGDAALYEDYVEIYRRMLSAEVRNLQISGMRHDTLADRDVLQDAFGAVLSSLENGFVIDGYLKLLMAFKLKMSQSDTFTKQVDTKFITYTTLHIILETIHKKAFFNDRGKKEFIDNLKLLTEEHDRGQNMTYYCYPVGETPTTLDCFHEGTIPVIQPADGYRELFLRVIDLLPKMINTSRAIIPNTVNG